MHTDADLMRMPNSAACCGLRIRKPIGSEIWRKRKRMAIIQFSSEFIGGCFRLIRVRTVPAGGG